MDINIVECICYPRLFLIKVYIINKMFYSGATISPVTSQQVFSKLLDLSGAFMCRVCMFFLCMCGFFLGALVFPHFFKTGRSTAYSKLPIGVDMNSNRPVCPCDRPESFGQVCVLIQEITITISIIITLYVLKAQA